MIDAVTRWKHWEFRIGRWAVSRWCVGAPCRLLTGGSAHPVQIVRVRRAAGLPEETPDG